MSRDFFAGCVNEPLPGVIERQVERECDLSEFSLTLADVVRSVCGLDARGELVGQLCLPDEFMPVPVDRLFA